ncbi:vacuolar ATPase assembly integral membrane protein VMA21 homolog isoform X3 [Anopheles albimanus]|uniref:vacuolar ATPase assembly integral membrane protein VMA21 homolog isoform X3 n=1 Tax=Anopheles albimanus TaxID=7167 RepID=UPI00163F2702|nr:vacuolar ATPase assembly integral membrane protein VMA21 homolog isoform X3 [Anopheles albimanus]
MSKSKLNKITISQAEQRAEYRTFKTVFFYCILIIVLPVTTFFSSKYWIFDGFFQLTHIASNIYSAISAVIALHAALFLFIYKAYFTVSTDASTSGSKADKVIQKED